MMLRGAFSTRNLRKLLLGDAHPVGRGAYAWDADRTSMLPVCDATQTHIARATPLVIFAGIDYGAGSRRDWAAKAPAVLGVQAVVAKSLSGFIAAI